MVSETLVSNSKRFCKLREHAHGACKVYTAALQHARGTRVRKISCSPIKFCIFFLAWDNPKFSKGEGITKLS